MSHQSRTQEINNFLLGGVEIVDMQETSSDNKPKKEEEEKKEIIVKKYMVEVTIYPNGEEYIKSWMVAKGPKKKKQVKKMAKPMQKTKIKKREVY